MPHVTTAHGQTAYTLSGREDAPLVVFFHGITIGAEVSFDSLMTTLKPHFRLLTLDFYGRGESDCPDPYAVVCDGDFYVNQAHEAITAVLPQCPPFGLIALSMGGAIAAMFCDRFPDLVKQLVLVAPAGFPVNIPLIAKLGVFPYVGEFFCRLGVTSWRLRQGFSYGFLDAQKHAEAVQKLQTAYDAQVSRSPQFPILFLNTLRNFPLNTLEPVYRSIGAHPHRKVMIVWGQKDDLVPFHNCPLVASCFRDALATVLEVPDAGHSLLHERPDVINPAVRDFLS
mmetsp:Transcript_29092/g.73129  ORF Transcript_29092/g.73129 Transcript_29092/m.73129 type:complete len:283 (-) Transcript_29092:80-928(-)